MIDSVLVPRSQAGFARAPFRTAARSRAARTEDAFDLLLGASLHDAFDAISSEPIPDAWLKLLEDRPA